MCPLWMILRASGLSIKMQCRTSRIPMQPQIYLLVNLIESIWLIPDLYSSPMHVIIHTYFSLKNVFCTVLYLVIIFELFGKDRIHIWLQKEFPAAIVFPLKVWSICEALKRCQKNTDRMQGVSQCCFTSGTVWDWIMSVPEEDSSLSSLLTSQSKLLENCVQLFLFPRINAAVRHNKHMMKSNLNI